MGIYSSFVLYFLSCVIISYPEVCSVSVNNGAYEDINIVIQDSVPEDETLLQRIQTIFTDASQLLFYATKQHVFFGKINIILPNTWSYKPEYTVIAARSELDSYITVEKSTRKRPPYTKPKEHKCGVHGHYIYLPFDFLLTEGKTEWGHHATVLVHEWAHYRWGLYDEYTTNKNARFYMDAGKWKQSRCSKEIKGKVGAGKRCNSGKTNCDTSDTSKKINQNCKFCPDESQNDDNFGSIMAYNWVDEVNMFCDDPDNPSVPIRQRHNKHARNNQNLICNHRSAWEVMRDHDDFKSAPLPASTNTTPVFQIQQEGFCNRVFVLDVSGSMGGSRIELLYETSKNIIETLIPDDSFLGIVWFATVATKKMELTKVISDAIRNALIDNLPTVASGGTCIGCGIEEALKMQPNNQTGIEIVLISDGENNEGNLDASIQLAVEAKATIHTIAVSQAADTKLASMAARTGGIHVSYLEGEQIFLTDTFLKVLPCGMTSYASELITVFSEKLNTSPSNEASVTFDIDSSIGNKTAVRVLLDTSANIDLEVSGPDGVVKNTTNQNGKSVVLVLPGTAVAGQYNAKVKSSSQANFEFYVTSLPNDPEAVRVSSRVSPSTLEFNGELPVITADVMKGRAPVTGANITAVVESGSSSCDVTLLDDVAAPDGFEDDGIYSAVIPRECLINGRLSSKIYVRGENGTTRVLYDLAGAGSPDSDEDSNNTEVLQINFQRVTVSNEIQVQLTNVLDQDIVAPGRITDVDIVDIATENTQYGESRNFTITWTATGDDENVGQAVEYELRISDDLSTLSNNFTSADLLDVVNTNFTPKAAGQTEAIRIKVDAEESYVSTVFFAVRARDDSGNYGPASNIVSIVVADGYRMKVEADVTVVYSDIAGSVEETPIEEKKAKTRIGLAVGLSLTGAFIVIVIIFVTCWVKNLKAKEIVEDCEFNSRTSITTVTSVDSKFLEYLATTAVRQTVSKKTFISSQLQTIPEKEQTWAQSFISRPSSAITSSRKPFDIISQGECSIEIFLDNNEITSEKFEDYLDTDTQSLSKESHFSGSEFTRIPNSLNTRDFCQNSPLNGATVGKSDNEVGHRYISERLRTECQTKNKSKHGFVSEMFEERPFSSRSLELPVLNDNEVNNEMKKYYEGIC